MLVENTMPEDPKETQGKNVSSVAIEEWLITNLAEACQVPREEVDVQLPLTSLGLDSLTLFELTGELADWLGQDIPTTLLWEFPTIAVIAEHLGQQSQSDEEFSVPSPCLVTLQPDGDLPPLFLAHDVSGTVWCYTNLLRHLGKERPVYGFQVPLREDEIFTVPSWEELAAIYVAELCRKQPSGPYYLGGFSMGGVMAFEMARQLRQRGEEVALLVMINSRFPRMKFRKASVSHLIRLHARYMRPLPLVDKVSYVLEHSNSPMSRRIRVHTRNLRGTGLMEKVRYFRGRISNHGLDEQAQKEDSDRQRFREGLLKSQVSHGLRKAHRAYTVSPYDGVITYLRAQWKYSLEDQVGAWRQVALGGIKRYSAPGSHGMLIMEPHVIYVAKLLEKCLSEAQSHTTR